MHFAIKSVNARNRLESSNNNARPPANELEEIRKCLSSFNEHSMNSSMPCGSTSNYSELAPTLLLLPFCAPFLCSVLVACIWLSWLQKKLTLSTAHSWIETFLLRTCFNYSSLLEVHAYINLAQELRVFKPSDSSPFCFWERSLSRTCFNSLSLLESILHFCHAYINLAQELRVFNVCEEVGTGKQPSGRQKNVKTTDGGFYSRTSHIFCISSRDTTSWVRFRLYW